MGGSWTAWSCAARRIFLGEHRPVLALALVAYGTITDDIWNAILSFFSWVAQGIGNFLTTIFQGLADLVASIFRAPVDAINQSFAQLSSFTAGFGPLAPIITVLITAAVILIVIFVVWLIIKLSIGEFRESANEAEEGL